MPLCQGGGIGFDAVKYLNIKTLHNIADDATKNALYTIFYVFLFSYYCIKDLFLIHYSSLIFYIKSLYRKQWHTGIIALRPRKFKTIPSATTARALPVAGRVAELYCAY